MEFRMTSVAAIDGDQLRPPAPRGLDLDLDLGLLLGIGLIGLIRARCGPPL
jgi:hypothetical protein